MSYLYFLLTYAGPFIALAIIYLVWAYTAFRWQHKYPRYYEWVCKTNEHLPKAGGFIVICAVLLYMFDVI